MFDKTILKAIGLTPDDINYVNDLAYRAGQLAKLRYEQGQIKVDTKEEPDDLVTQVDKELSNLIINDLKKRFPQDGIISEEEPPHNEGLMCNRFWVIDPIDGTSHYIKNNGQYSVMIGILQRERPVIGWVYSPEWDKLVIGIPGDGLFERIATGPTLKKIPQLCQTKPEKNLRLMIGSRNRKKDPELAQKLTGFECVEMGSLGLKVILIVEDKADIFIHTINKLKLWDTVAPSAIALAANLVVSTLEETEFSFSVDQFEHHQSYAVGLQWAFGVIKKRLQ